MVEYNDDFKMLYKGYPANYLNKTFHQTKVTNTPNTHYDASTRIAIPKLLHFITISFEIVLSKKKHLFC